MGVRTHYARYPEVVGQWIKTHPDHRECVESAARGWIDDSLLEEMRDDPEYVPEMAVDIGRDSFELFVESDAFEAARDYRIDQPPHRLQQLDIEKSWRALHPLLTGELHPIDRGGGDDGQAEPPASWILNGPVSDGEHWSCHVLDPDRVAEIWEYLEPIDYNDLEAWYETRLDGDIRASYELEYVLDRFDELSRLFYLADDDDDCVLMWWTY